MTEARQETRRGWITSFAGLLGVVALPGGVEARQDKKTAAPKAKPEEMVSPGEDLMREHGVLRRVMFLYDEAALRLDARTDVDGRVLASGAGIVRRVIEEYHEKLEEQFVFPRFERASKLVDLVTVLRKQHLAGRRVTDGISTLSKGALRAEADRRKLADAMRAFNRMYRAHAAREDTVLFPAFHDLVGEKAYGELGEEFEDKERTVLGDKGFERAVADVAALETRMGIADIDKFTPA
jgi:hemerythrin-like domain-containing protein